MGGGCGYRRRQVCSLSYKAYIEAAGRHAGANAAAARLKAQHNLPYADCFAATLAQSRKAALVTSDKDFQRAKTALKILWV